MPEVDILMAAYNGEKYIAEQIESILAQTFQDFRLLIRDDGSTDNTPAIIEKYAAKYPGKIEVVHDDVDCHSAVKNFFQLLTYARADYVMFSDQDDVWLPYKVQISLDYMKEAERKNPGEPVLVFTGLHVVDAKLKSMDRFMALGLMRARYTTVELLLANCVSGCTEMANRKLYEALGSYSPQIMIHDYWMALYAYACGVICNVPMALILYRQHSNNLIGAGKPINGGGEVLSA
ncbi:MAG: glycosyltransferase family 2 protein [Synergistaceae bacterium]|nr:glycosyltransferase family 2 protein [Synergistaceae bacterium]